MNIPMILYIISRMLGIEGLLLMVPAFVAMYYGESSLWAFLITAAVLLIPFVIWRKRPENTKIYLKDGYAVVAMIWLFWSLAGALPFFLSGEIPSYIDALFETLSGFTTAGSTILTEIETLPKAILFWRSFTHWIGGMGVLVFVLAFMSLMNQNLMYLMKAEMPGPTVDKILPRARDTAKYLYAIYFVLTIMEIILLLLGGMSFYDSVIHAFSTAGTGGFSSKNASIGYYDSVYLDVVITVFMVLFGVNFSLYYLLLLGKIKQVWKNEELRFYFGILAGATVLITWNIRHLYGGLSQALRYAGFQVASIMSTTGFATADFDQWPLFSKYILLVLMVIGGCAGSTGGGMKVARIMLLGKTIKAEVRRIISPRSVNVVRIDGRRVEDDVLQGVWVYFFAHILIFAVSVFLISFDVQDLGTSLTAVLTTLNTTGPGINGVGPSMNFSEFSGFSKLVFCFDMLVGRLEVFPVLMFFAPSLWRQKFK